MEGPDMNSVLPDSVSLGSSLTKRRSGGGVEHDAVRRRRPRKLEVTGFTHELTLDEASLSSSPVTQDAKSVAGDAPRDGREGSEFVTSGFVKFS
jgi:hypothetical protein